MMDAGEARCMAPRFRVRHRSTWYGLVKGDFVVGRSPGCQLLLDDPRVSRRHARFRVADHRLTLEDLHSRNGTLLNGVTLRGPMVLSHDDLITIGSQELRVAMVPDGDVILPGERLSAPDGGFGDITLIGGLPALINVLPGERLSAPDGGFGDITLIGGLPALINVLDHTLRAGDQEEVERILGQLYHELDEEWRVRARLPSTAVLESITRITLVHAMLTRRCPWIDRLFALYHRLRVVMPPSLIDDVSTILLQARHQPSPQLREYSEWVHGEVGRLGPSERFAYQRLEHLLRTLRAQ
jgi:FOG: FHA domain